MGVITTEQRWEELNRILEIEKKQREHIIKSKRKREKVLEKYNSHCAYCGKLLEYNNFQVDHIIPDGGNELDNLNPSCRKCNRAKSNNSIEKFRKLCARKALGIPNFSTEQKEYLKKNGINIDSKINSVNYKFFYEIYTQE